MLSVIIPVYNEKKTFSEIARRVCAVNIPKQIIVVDDFSTDGTRDILKEFEKNPPDWMKEFPHNRFEFVYQPYNQGKGAAIRAGIPFAKESITLIQDADLEYDPADYPTLIAPITKGEADVVYGSRFAQLTGKDRFTIHVLGNRFLTFLSNMFTGLCLTDMETCYKVFKTPLIQSIPLRSNRFGVEPEVTAKIAKLGWRVSQVPISYKGRGYSEGKKIGPKDALQAFHIIVKYWLIDDLGSAKPSS